MIHRQVVHTVGMLLIMLGFSMSFSVGWSLYYESSDLYPLIKALLVTTFCGLVLYYLFRPKEQLNLTSRDGFAIVTIGWICMALFSALPFYYSIEELNYTNSFFEAMSGLTTTGASVLGDSTITIDNMRQYHPGILFWRSFTHFIGGMGIIVFSIAILPMLGMGGVQLFRAEIAGPAANKLTPRVKQTAKLLWGIYVGFVLILALILKLEGMIWFDAFCHSFATMATGGFSTFSDSIGSQSSLIQWTLIIFMFLAATNFSLHYFFIAKGKFGYFKDNEFRYYLAIGIFFSLLFFINITNTLAYKIDISSLRSSIFTTISLLTTTGFTTVDFETWPTMSNMLVFMLLFIGGSAGSTTGGMKIIRTIVVSRYLLCEIKRLLHPKGIFNIKLGNKVIEDDVVKATVGFYLLYLFIFILTAFCLSMSGQDFTTSLTASASAIGNIGPGLGDIGPMDNWGHLTYAGKWLTSFCMLLGRLEIFTVMVLFSRSFWKK